MQVVDHSDVAVHPRPTSPPVHMSRMLSRITYAASSRASRSASGAASGAVLDPQNRRGYFSDDVNAASTLLFDAASMQLALGAEDAFDLKFVSAAENNTLDVVVAGTAFVAHCSPTAFHMILAQAAHKGLLSNIRIAPTTTTIRIDHGMSDLIRKTIRKSGSPQSILAAHINPMPIGHPMASAR